MWRGIRQARVVGLGSIGLDIATRLAATGLTHIGLMDFDVIEPVNLDRLIGATAIDALLGRRKIDVAERVVRTSATARNITIETFDTSICEPAGQRAALDYDIVFCCVDRPWPRAVLNQIAYTDLIPVIDGGIAIDAFADGGIRNATWRTHVVAPGRPCLVCNNQLDPGQVALDISGLLDDPTYIAGAADDQAHAETSAANVAILSIGAAASQLAQYVSLNTSPGGLGDPGPLQFLLSTHTLEHLAHESEPNCHIETQTGAGDRRIDLTGAHPRAENQRAVHDERNHRWRVRALRYAEELINRFESATMSRH